ncbi:MAG: hydrogenase accessory protein HypB, partial [Desulfobacterales bacterium]|nr:hydrogenase accessory protein HypB [Desulfobacterales bacterium]
LLNKIDLLPYLEDFDVKLAADNIRQIHPGMPVFETSAKTEEGFGPWLDWLRSSAKEKLG